MIAPRIEPGPRALLVFPPQWAVHGPHFALRGLAGHLRSRGITVAVRDLNIEYFDAMLTPEALQLAIGRLKLIEDYTGTQYALESKLGGATRQTKIDLQRHRAWLAWQSVNPGLAAALPRTILDAKETFRDPRRFYNPDLLAEAFAVLDSALELLSMPYHPARISLNSYDQPDCDFDVASLIEFTADLPNNPFAEFFADCVPGMLAEQPHYIGISINAFSQVIPGLTIARMLKEAGAPHVGIGGNFFERVADTLSERPHFFEAFADSLAVGEGERTVEYLVQALAAGTSLAEVPNILYYDRDEQVVRVTPTAPPPPMDEVGIQDLAGLPLDLYLAPDLVLTIQAGKGCYWGRCTFCDSYVGVTPDEKGIDRLIREITHLRDTYGVRHYQFIDEAISPDRLRLIADRFMEADLDIEWFCNGRLENRFTPGLMQVLHAAGLRMVLWGVETGSKRIFKLIRKGVDFEKRIPLLRGSADAGVWNFAYIFFGFPSETYDEALETVEMICANTDVIHSYGKSIFTLGKHAPLFRDAAKLGLVDMYENREELSTNLHYRDTRGMSDEELNRASGMCTRLCAQAYDRGVWFLLRYREFIHLYLCHFGRDAVAQMKMPTYKTPTEQYF